MDVYIVQMNVRICYIVVSFCIFLSLFFCLTTSGPAQPFPARVFS